MRARFFKTLLLIFLLQGGSDVLGDEVSYKVTGVEDPVLTNVINHVTAFRIGSGAKLNSRLRRRLIEDTRATTMDAMRPFGFFNPTVSVGIEADGDARWLVNVDIRHGPPVRVSSVDLEFSGPGRELPELKVWRKDFPLAVGDVLDQPKWDRAKTEAIEHLEANGYLSATFNRQAIRVDPVANTAILQLTLDTGPQAVMGEVRFRQDILKPGILSVLQRFNEGDAYNSWLLSRFRLDLWRTGYFEDIRIVERRNLDTEPPRVDLEVDLTPRKKNAYQGTIGFGTDTQARVQFRWGRHLISKRGDNFDIGFGWQQKNNEFSFQTNYRLPRKTETRQFWIAQLALKSENQTMTVSPENDPDTRIDIARGNYNDYSLRVGRTRVRNFRGGHQQLYETVFVQYLRENNDFKLVSNTGPVSTNELSDSAVDLLLDTDTHSAAVGIEWDWPKIRGRGFDTTGHHERVWILTSNDAWGSDINFTQVYLSGRYNKRVGDRWKFLMRAEAGYTDSRTQDFVIPTEDGDLNISLTELPYYYRFKAGGSRSVRGYSFERLTNNNLGSNNVFTASAEVEFLLLDNWSIAAFADIGNAFNDWSRPNLKFGSGVGIRWYSVIGALRLDVAKGWDSAGEPWRIHLTIGTTLL